MKKNKPPANNGSDENALGKGRKGKVCIQARSPIRPELIPVSVARSD